MYISRNYFELHELETKYDTTVNCIQIKIVTIQFSLF